MKTISRIIMTLMVITTITTVSEAQTNFTKKVGGNQGTSFMLPSSRQAILSTDRITGIAIQHGRRVEQIELEYSIGEGFNLVEHIGNDAGKWSYIKLEPGEFITYITGQAGTLIDQITFHTSLRRTFGPYGGSGGQYFEITVPSDAMIIGFTGKVGPSINQIGLIYRRPDHNISRNKNRGTHFDGRATSEKAVSNSRVVRDHRTAKEPSNGNQDSVGVVYANGIGALIQVTQLKSQFANEEALQGADKQKDEVDKKDKNPKQNNKK
jgi:hypothetical protein